MLLRNGELNGGGEPLDTALIQTEEEMSGGSTNGRQPAPTTTQPSTPQPRTTQPTTPTQPTGTTPVPEPETPARIGSPIEELVPPPAEGSPFEPEQPPPDEMTDESNARSGEESSSVCPTCGGVVGPEVTPQELFFSSDVVPGRLMPPPASATAGGFTTGKIIALTLGVGGIVAAVAFLSNKP